MTSRGELRSEVIPRPKKLDISLFEMSDDFVQGITGRSETIGHLDITFPPFSPACDARVARSARRE